MITFVQTREGFNVKVPYEIKDDFKSAFKTATWSKYKKVWKVDNIARKKLEEFNEKFNKKVEENEQQDKTDDQILLTGKEIETINASLAKTIERLDSISEKINKIEMVKELLDATKLELDELKVKDSIRLDSSFNQKNKKDFHTQTYIDFTDNFFRVLKSGISQSEMKVLTYIIDKMEFGNLIAIKQSAIAKAIDIPTSNLSRCFKSLLDKNILVKDAEGNVFVNSNVITKSYSSSQNAESCFE